MRRSKGEGSVYKRKDGLWVARYEAAGKRKYLYGKTKKIVTDKLRDRVNSGMLDLTPEADTMLVGEYLDRWLLAVKDTVKERTWVRHEVDVRVHIRPSLGGIKLCKLNSLDLQEFYRIKLHSGLSPRSVGIIHATLYKALKQAVVWSLVTRNVAEIVMPPKVHKKEIRTLTQEEVRRLLVTVDGDRFEALYVLAVTTGIRQGELLGLKWEDVDLEEGVLRIRRTLWKGRTSSPKTANAIRSVRLPRMAREALKKQQAQGKGREWVFSTRNGTPVNCHNLINRSWWPLLKRMDLSKIPFHNLRHTCATLLLCKGVHPKIVQELLGHADITTTLNTYSHVIPSLEGKAASAMEEMLEP